MDKILKYSKFRRKFKLDRVSWRPQKTGIFGGNKKIADLNNELYFRSNNI